MVYLRGGPHGLKPAEDQQAKADRPASSARGAGSPGNGRETMNNIIWLVGAVVIVIAILSFFGLR
ncbi:hypothetical protein C7I87_09670 [Mesorhizobium sp. SARCC-RB16n]|nr:hypothetical protein C7I87_09670 [Mesorhizobium sp. SARCC-RB16n]